MGTIELFKLMRKKDEWRFEDAHGQRSLRKIIHKSGIWFFQNAWAGVVRCPKGDKIKSGFFTWLFCIIPATSLDRKFN